MASKMITDREKATAELKGWVSTHGPVVATAAKERLGAAADPSELVTAAVTSVEAALTRLVKADEANIQETLDDAAPRRERDEAAAKVASPLVELRTLVAPAGDEALSSVGLKEPVSRDPTVVARLGHRLVELADKPGFKLPARPGVQIDLAYFLDAVRGELGRLDKALERVKTEEAELVGTQRAKDAALEAFDAAFVACGTLLRGLGLLVGARPLVETLPTLHRATRGAAGEPEPEPAGG